MLEFIPSRQVPQRLSEGWQIVSHNRGDYAALMHAPEGWEPVVVPTESISLLYRVDGVFKRLDGKKPIKREGDRRVLICRLPDCDRKHYGAGFCRKHYHRLKKNGHPRIVRAAGRPKKIKCRSAA